MHRLDPARATGQLRGGHGGDPLGECGAVRAGELDRVAGVERPLTGDDTDAEEAPAVIEQRAACAGVDDDAPPDGLAEAQPELERRLAALGGGEARAARLAGEDRLRAPMLPVPRRSPSGSRPPRARRRAPCCASRPAERARAPSAAARAAAPPGSNPRRRAPRRE
jgi:hypothetical protein